MKNPSPELQGSDKMRKEIHALIQRWSQESEITTYTVIGCLQAVQMDLWDELENYQNGLEQL